VVTDSRRQQADALLKNLQQQQGGQLKIFLGAAPGVGKTCAMLNAARERMQQGTAVMVGLVETHGRADTEALLQGFELLPRRQLDYQGQQLTEFDLDAALAARPALLLVDELAHSNIPGSRHCRVIGRWHRCVHHDQCAAYRQSERFSAANQWHSGEGNSTGSVYRQRAAISVCRFSAQSPAGAFTAR
jgi:hypothetical protein